MLIWSKVIHVQGLQEARRELTLKRETVISSAPHPSASPDPKRQHLHLFYLFPLRCTFMYLD